VDYNSTSRSLWKREKPKKLMNQSVWALSGIGNHKAFVDTIYGLGASYVKSISFRDHHRYSEKDIESICSRVMPDEYLVTTEKDWIRLMQYSKYFSAFKKMFYLEIEFVIPDREQENLLQKQVNSCLQLDNFSR
jgi:tetraacyldisaccharide 4'-kinase